MISMTISAGVELTEATELSYLQLICLYGGKNKIDHQLAKKLVNYGLPDTQPANTKYGHLPQLTST